MDFIRATGSTSLTVNAEPDGVAFQDFFLHPHLDHPNDLVGSNIHIGRRGTTRRTFKALVTETEVLPALFLHFFQKRRINFPHAGHSLQFLLLLNYNRYSSLPPSRHDGTGTLGPKILHYVTNVSTIFNI